MEYKDIVLFGAGIEGKQFADMVQNGKCKGLEHFRIAYFCDNYVASGSYVRGVKVINAFELQKMERKYDVFICSEKHLDEIMEQLYKMKIQNAVYYVPPYVYAYKYNNEDMPIAIKMNIEKPRLSWLEIEIVKHCNMNCNGCSVCANISNAEYKDIESFERDMRQLKKYYSGIKVLKLFGGEPLLHPQIGEFVICARKYYPDAKLLVHSNGLLIPSSKESLLKIMSEKDAEFVFTLYPETGKLKRKIELKLQKSNVTYEFTEPVYEFRKAININGDYNPQEVFSNCCKCWGLTDGRLSCGFPELVEKIETAYKVKICDNKYVSSVDIYKSEMNGWDINRMLNKAYGLCAYCAFMRFNIIDDENSYYTWRRDEPKLEDWVV